MYLDHPHARIRVSGNQGWLQRHRGTRVAVLLSDVKALEQRGLLELAWDPQGDRTYALSDRGREELLLLGEAGSGEPREEQ